LPRQRLDAEVVLQVPDLDFLVYRAGEEESARDGGSERPDGAEMPVQGLQMLVCFWATREKNQRHRGREGLIP